MKDFLKSIYLEIFEEEGIKWKVLGIIIWAISIALLVLGSFLVIIVCDSSFAAKKCGNGIITNKAYYTSRNNNYSFLVINNPFMPICKRSQGAYKVSILLEGEIAMIAINKESWDENCVGQSIFCYYTKGCLTGRIVIKSIKIIN